MSQRFPASVRPPVPTAEPSRTADLRTWLPEAGRTQPGAGPGHLGHSQVPRRKCSRAPEQPIHSPSLAVSSGASLPKSNAETPPANQRRQGAMGVSGSAPFPSPVKRIECGDAWSPMSGRAAARGCVRAGPSLLPGRPRALLEAPPSLTSVPWASAVLLAREPGGAAFLPPGAAAAGPAGYT